MKKLLKTKTTLWGLLALLVFATLAFAATVSVRPGGVAFPYWYSYSAGAKSTYYLTHPTLTANEEVVSLTATQTMTNKTLTSPTITSPTISSPSISGLTRSFPLNIVSGYIDGTGLVGADGTTAPGIAETDNIPKLVWANDEVTPVQWTFRVPADYSSGMSFRVLASESSDTTPSEIDFQLWVNSDGAVFDAAVTDNQSAVALADCDATNEVVTLTPTSTALSAIVAGAWITLDIFNTTTGNGSLEVAGVDVLYTPQY